jgi:hypothetical protein
MVRRGGYACAPLYRIVTKRKVLAQCLSVHIELFGSHWMDFDEICYLRLFLKSVKKIEVLLKFDFT